MMYIKNISRQVEFVWRKLLHEHFGKRKLRGKEMKLVYHKPKLTYV